MRKTDLFLPAGFSRRSLLLGGAAVAGAGLLPRHAGAQLRVDVPQGNIQPISIAIPDFLAGSASEGDTPRNISGIVVGNLKRSGLFAPIDPAAFIEKVINFDAPPRFPDWRAINAAGLVTGRVTRQTDGRL